MLRSFILFLFSASLILGQEKLFDVSTPINESPNQTAAQPDAEWSLYPCGTPYPSSEEVIKSKMNIDEWLAQNTTRDNDPVHVLVAWHVVYSSTNAGYLSEAFIENSIDRINQENYSDVSDLEINDLNINFDKLDYHPTDL